jgi:nucleoid DNA-binding protein
MPHTPPIQRNKNRHLLNDERFYRLLGHQYSHISKDEAFVMYIAIVKLVEQELRRHKMVRLPHLGDFALVKYKSRPALVGSKQVKLPEREVLKFYPKERLRRYFNAQQPHPMIQGVNNTVSTADRDKSLY